MGVDLSESASPVRILETVLYAHDLAAIQDFYRRVFGLEPFAVAADRHVFYRCGDQMLLIFNPSVTRVPQAQGSFPMLPHGAEGEGHICFRASADDIAAWRQRLEDLGVAINGNCLEFAEPRIWGIA
jgi:catechol 2,3-dioxygenase-like lactoylglutathione lyase family enzyme